MRFASVLLLTLSGLTHASASQTPLCQTPWDDSATSSPIHADSESRLFASATSLQPHALQGHALQGYALQRHAGLLDYVSNNRSRMIQVATIAFALGLVILMTATRKH